MIDHSPKGAFQGQCKQIILNEHNIVKNPNWQEADQLAIYKARRINSSSGRKEDLNPDPPVYKSGALPLGHACLPD